MHNSLSFRLISLSSIWILLTLAATALLLAHFYRDHITQHFDDILARQTEALASAAGISQGGVLTLKPLAMDPHFLDPGSGWYWEIRRGDSTLERSRSLGDGRLDLIIPDLTASDQLSLATLHEVTGADGALLRVRITGQTQSGANPPLIFIASAPAAAITEDVLAFTDHILGSFLLLGAGLLLAVVLQVRLALKPLKAIRADIGNLRQGEVKLLPDDYPDDVQPLADELNNLLEHNTVLLRRARNSLGDLAHAVKNPLTVLIHEAAMMPKEQGSLVTQQASDISRSINHYLARARTSGAEKVLGSRTPVKDIVEDLLFVMRRLYRNNELEFDTSGLGGCKFRGESQDLEDMLGNLLDNACKWAERRVLVHCRSRGDRLLISVEDDGPGIPAKELDSVLDRGEKLDASKPGQGLGLSIANEIATLYGGGLSLSRSGYGGLCAELELPGAGQCDTK